MTLADVIAAMEAAGIAEDKIGAVSCALASLPRKPNAEHQAKFRAKSKAKSLTVRPYRNDDTTLRSFGEAWNALAGQLKLPQIDEIKPGSMRERHALARLRELGDKFDDLLAHIKGSPYLRGEVNGFRATFDWIINPSNCQKIMDGNYEAREKRQDWASYRR